MASSQYEALMKAISALLAAYVAVAPSPPPVDGTWIPTLNEDGTPTLDTNGEPVRTYVPPPDDAVGVDPVVEHMQTALTDFVEHMKTR